MPVSQSPPSRLPPEMTVLERGWLSANNIVFQGKRSGNAVVDTGYVSHAEQTVQLLENCLQGQPLHHILNTHLHSDHCGGNAALQARWPDLRTDIAPGQAEFVLNWNPEALSYTPTGQECPRFIANGLLQPGTEVELGDRAWQIHAAPGHDPHSIILFEPENSILISADALWENGFGVVFPEIEGIAAFDEVAGTLDVIERLSPHTIIPGHGNVFSDLAPALAKARARLDYFKRQPERHALYAAKVLIKYKLLEWQNIDKADLQRWALATPYLGTLQQRYFSHLTIKPWLDELLNDLVQAGAAKIDGARILNT